jgi:hypothetical protein
MSPFQGDTKRKMHWIKQLFNVYISRDDSCVSCEK